MSSYPCAVSRDELDHDIKSEIADRHAMERKTEAYVFALNKLLAGESIEINFKSVDVRLIIADSTSELIYPLVNDDIDVYSLYKTGELNSETFAQISAKLLHNTRSGHNEDNY